MTKTSDFNSSLMVLWRRPFCYLRRGGYVIATVCLTVLGQYYTQEVSKRFYVGFGLTVPTIADIFNFRCNSGYGACGLQYGGAT